MNPLCHYHNRILFFMFYCSIKFILTRWKLFFNNISIPLTQWKYSQTKTYSGYLNQNISLTSIMYPEEIYTNSYPWKYNPHHSLFPIQWKNVFRFLPKNWKSFSIFLFLLTWKHKSSDEHFLGTVFFSFVFICILFCIGLLFFICNLCNQICIHATIIPV